MRYYALTMDEVLQVVAKCKTKRPITAVHLHHTVVPGQDASFGRADLERTAETYENKQLPQHVTIDRTGQVWTGRHWELPPASVDGHNAEAFSIALVGDFNRERLEGAQWTTVVTLAAELLRKHGLSEKAIAFHSDYNPTLTCPGATIDADAFRADVKAALKRAAPAAGAPRVTGPFLAEYSAVAALLDDLAQPVQPLAEPQAADAREAALQDAVALVHVRSARTGTPPPRRMLNQDAITELRPHVVNLTQGLLSPSGRYKTQPHHLVEMFNVSLPQYITRCRQTGRTPRLVFFAHGGLNSEEAGLEGALNQLEWWNRNQVYPVFFVWETGLLQAIRFLIRPAAGTRNIFSDNISDPLIERTVHAIGGVSIWGNMKQAAERAATHAQGGSNLVAARLAALMTANPDLQVHTIGHSAGAIFQAHFLEALARNGAPRDLNGLHYFAPAIRVDEFKNHVVNRIGAGKGVAALSMFTMRSNLEEDDTCAGIYRKSLLCLIRAGLEPRRNTPILGLEESIGEDDDLLAFFGLDGSAPGADLVFSLSPSNAAPERRSTARQHGAFDNNVETMDSVMRRILGVRDAAAMVSFAESSAATRAFEDVDPFATLPEDIRLFLTGGPAIPLASTPTDPARPQPVVPQPVVPQSVVPQQPAVMSRLGQRRALCVGINDYGPQSLRFCVADAELWARSLEQQGFAVTILRDREATRDGILGALRELVHAAVPGDVLVFQIAGHGTKVPDLDGDEAKNAPDFGYVPYDYESGALVLDDDLFAVWRELREGVIATSFFDACHSGEGLRQFVSADQIAPSARFLSLTPEQQRKHLQYRSAMGLRSLPVRSGEIRGKLIFFSACAQDELALERDGNGDFTRHAAPHVGLQLSNRDFHQRVLAAFGPSAVQTPQIEAAPTELAAEIGALAFLQPLAPQLRVGLTLSQRDPASTARLYWRRDQRPQPRA